MIIREACVDDAPAIAVMRNETWQSAYRGVIAEEYLDAMSLEDARACFTAGIASPEERFFVAIDGREVIGFSVCGKGREGASQFQGEVYAIYVRPCRHRSGAGRLLFRAAATRRTRWASGHCSSGRWPTIATTAFTSAWAGAARFGENTPSAASSMRWSPTNGTISRMSPVGRDRLITPLQIDACAGCN